MGFKINKVENILLKEISYLLATEIKDKNIKFVTVTAVKLNNDLSQAKVYVTVLNDDKREETMEALNHARKFIRSKLHEKIDMRQIPEILFIYDQSIAEGNKIEKIIKDLNKN